MDLIIFERKAFEEFATKIEQFILRVSKKSEQPVKAVPNPTAKHKCIIIFFIISCCL